VFSVEDLMHDPGRHLGGIPHGFVGSVGVRGGPDEVLLAKVLEDDAQGVAREIAAGLGLDLGRGQRPAGGPQGGENLALQLTRALPLAAARGHGRLTLTGSAHKRSPSTTVRAVLPTGYTFSSTKRILTRPAPARRRSTGCP
jgi:hypothetical protein